MSLACDDDDGVYFFDSPICGDASYLLICCDDFYCMISNDTFYHLNAIYSSMSYGVDHHFLSLFKNEITHMHNC